LYGEALRLAEEIGDQGEISETLLNMANNLYTQGDLERATKLYRRTLSIAKPNHLNHSAAAALNNLGEIQTQQGKLPDAKQSFEEALRLHRAAGEEAAILYPLEGLGDLFAVSGNLAGAADRLEEALEVMRKTGKTESESSIVAHLAYVDYQKGDIPAARSKLEQAIQIDTSAGFKEHLSRVRVQLAELDLEQGRLTEAKVLADQALTELEAHRMRDDQLEAYRVRALVLWKLGQPLSARSDIERATKLSRSSQNQLERTNLVIATARIESASGGIDEAISRLAPVAADSERYGFVIRQLEAKLALGEIELKGGQPRSGRERLKQLQKDAASKGLGLLAAKAESVLHPESS
jgi:tetratricopeptide (TPR) repeat protein